MFRVFKVYIYSLLRLKKLCSPSSQQAPSSFLGGKSSKEFLFGFTNNQWKMRVLDVEFQEFFAYFFSLSLSFF
jgi:hypothetical protein